MWRRGAMGLRNRIMLLVALGLVVATAPLGLMGLAMVRTAMEHILEERLAMTRATADHLSAQVAQGWWQLDRLSTRAAAPLRRGDLAPIRGDFAEIAPQMPLFSGGVFLLDETGHLLVQESTLRSPPPLRDVASVQVTLREARPQTGLAVRGPGGVSLAVFSVPVFASPGRVSGAVVGVIDLNKPTLLAFLNGLAIGTSGHAALVSREGTVLASTDTAELFTKDEHPEFFRTLIDGGRAVIGRAQETAAGGASQTHVTTFAPLSAVPWGLGIGQTEDEALGPLRRLRDRIVIFETIVILAALLFAWADTSAVVRPVGLLRSAAERIAEGDLAQEIDVRRGDEIGGLARAFETMRRRLLSSLDENARLQERLQSVAVLEERERIAREMHDSVGQVLGYVNTKAQAVHALLETGNVTAAQTQLVQLEQAAREVYADLREAIVSLRTTTGPDRRLLPALREYVRRFTEVSGVETRLVLEGDTDGEEFSPPVEAHLIRIIQEALTNVRKHAAARRAVVRVTFADRTATVAVEDDGVGMDAASGPSEHLPGFGLQTMRERAEAVGGSMTIRARPGGGTVVEVTVPRQHERESRARPAG